MRISGGDFTYYLSYVHRERDKIAQLTVDRIIHIVLLFMFMVFHVAEAREP